MHRDVCIIGGGPAGLAAAIALRSKGLSVTVLDARRPPIDKACGEGLLPGGLRTLRELGVPLGDLNGAPLRGIRFLGGGISVSGRFPEGEGRGVRRTTLHAVLVECAERAGAELQWNRPVCDFESVTARWIIGADGIQSRVRQWAGLAGSRRDSTRFGFQCHYPIEPWSDEVEVYWGSRGQAYVTPAGPSQIGVAVLTRHRGLRFDDIVRQFPELSARLHRSARTPERGGVTATRRLRCVAKGNIALLGDASGSVDAITGEGLALSFRQALLLADSLDAGNLDLYACRHAALSHRTRFMGDLMLLLDRSSHLRRHTLGVLASRPALFERLVEMHTGEPSLPTLLAGCAHLGWGLATAPLFPGS
jgi:flavin-dependent dehydrogenase